MMIRLNFWRGIYFLMSMKKSQDDSGEKYKNELGPIINKRIKTTKDINIKKMKNSMELQAEDIIIIIDSKGNIAYEIYLAEWNQSVFRRLERFVGTKK